MDQINQNGSVITGQEEQEEAIQFTSLRLPTLPTFQYPPSITCINLLYTNILLLYLFLISFFLYFISKYSLGLILSYKHTRWINS